MNVIDVKQVTLASVFAYVITAIRSLRNDMRIVRTLFKVRCRWSERSKAVQLPNGDCQERC